MTQGWGVFLGADAQPNDPSVTKDHRAGLSHRRETWIVERSGESNRKLGLR